MLMNLSAKTYLALNGYGNLFEYVCFYSGSPPDDGNQPATGALLAQARRWHLVSPIENSIGEFILTQLPLSGAIVASAVNSSGVPVGGYIQSMPAFASGVIGYASISKGMNDPERESRIYLSVGTSGSEITLGSTTAIIGSPVEIRKMSLTIL